MFEMDGNVGSTDVSPLSPCWKPQTHPSPKKNITQQVDKDHDDSSPDINEELNLPKSELSGDDDELNNTDLQQEKSPMDEPPDQQTDAQPDPSSDHEDSILLEFDAFMPAHHNDRCFSPEHMDSSGTSWRVMWFPNGNDSSHQSEFSSCYLEMVKQRFRDEDSVLRKGKEVEFDLSIVNQLYPGKDISKPTECHEFTSRSTDWGFKQFMLISDLLSTTKGFNINDTIKIHVVIRPSKLNLYSRTQSSLTANPVPSMLVDYDSKQETGMVGLKNQGATCYMNSLLQTLFHIRKLRKAVYDMPTEEGDNSTSVALALQRVFYRLQTYRRSVSTKELTKSFGWGHFESFMQHDVQELNRILCDKLEEKMKKTSVDGTIKNLFEGLVRSFLKCLNVDFTSSREECFYDIQLDVKGCKNVYESFDKYVEVEILRDENQYEAEGYGKQDAEKGMRFSRFPPVLNIHLKRFEYDPLRDGMVKVHDRFEFPDELDLDPYIDHDKLTEKESKYILHSVLVHSGDVHGGHYYVFIRPNDEEWFMFDDDRITKVPEDVAIQGNYGGSDSDEEKNQYGKRTRGLLKSFSSAYMLVYIRKTDLPDVMLDIEEEDIPKHLVQRFKREEEAAAKKKRDLEEAHLYIMVSVASDDTIGKFNDYSFTDDFAHFSYEAEKFKVRKDCSLKDLLQLIEQRLNIPVHQQRLWNCITRENKTTRVDSPVSSRRMDAKLEDIAEDISVRPNWKVYLEVVEDSAENECRLILNRPVSTTVSENIKESDNDLALATTTKSTPSSPSVTSPSISSPSVPREVNDSEILLFIKLYNENHPLDSRLTYMGHVLINHDATGDALLQVILKSRMPDTQMQLTLYEEVTPRMVTLLPLKSTLLESELQNGDIICCHCHEERGKTLPEDDATKDLPFELIKSYSTVDGYFEYLTSKIEVNFRSIHYPRDEEFTLNLLLGYSYDYIVEKIADYLNTQPCFIRLTQHNSSTNAPKNYPLSYSECSGKPGKTLLTFLRTFAEKTDILYYEILKYPIQDIESQRQMFLAYSTYHEDPSVERSIPSKEYREVTVLVPKESCIRGLLQAVHADQDLPSTMSLRLFSIEHCSLKRVYQEDEEVGIIPNVPRWQQHSNLLVEPLPEEMEQLMQQDKIQWKLLYVTHIQFPTPQSSWITKHGVPFTAFIQEGDTLGDLRERIRNRLRLTKVAMAKVRLSIVENSNAEKLETIPNDSNATALDPKLFNTNDLTIGVECMDRCVPASRYPRRIEQGIKISDN